MNVQLVVYALVATMSPLGLAVTMAVLTAGRAKALLFALGFVLAQGLACALIALVDLKFVAAFDHDRLRLRGALELAFGVAALALAVVVRRRGVAESPGSRGFAERLEQVGATTAFLAGVLLGIGGPKRLVLTALAGTTIAASGVGDAEALAAVALYTAIATLLVWLPVLGFVFVGERVVGRLRAAEGWLARHQREVAFWSLLVIGAFAVVDGVAKLV